MNATASLAAPEPAIEPELPIVDAHHHLWWHPGNRYLLDEFAADLNDGHQIRATVYIECHAMLRPHGPEAMKPVGEVEFANGVAAMSASGLWGPTRVCEAIVGHADLTLGAEVDDVLDALLVAGGERLRGIRVSAAWDGNPGIKPGIRPFAPPGLLLDARFREGFARVAARGLVFDALQYHPQLADLCSLADAFPDAVIVLNHCGGLLGNASYAHPGNFAHWRHQVAEVARRPNVQMKLGGLSARRCGFGFDQRPTAPTSTEVAAAFRPYIESCIELFGPARCLYESNYPPDRVAGSYRLLWNALKLTASGCSAAEKSAMFHDNACRIYGIEKDQST